MASKKKKKKVTKAAKSVVKGAKIPEITWDKIQADVLKELQDAFADALTKPYALPLQYISPKQTGKTWTSLQLAELYGKAGQVGSFGSYTGENAEQHKWLTWMRHQMLKLHPGVSKTEIVKEAPWQQVRFNVYVVALGQMYKFSQAVPMEFLVSASDLEELGHHVLKDLKAEINKALPQAMPKPGNMTVVESKYMDKHKMFIVPKDMHNDFEKFVKSYKDPSFKELATKWLSDHKPPELIIPVPPEKDKDYSLTPVQVYNDALQKIENHAKTVNHSTVWGEIEKSTLQYIKEQAALAEAKPKNRHGFSGSVVQDSLKNVLPCLYEQVKCPKCGHKDNMADMIIHLNDSEMWSREQIADWAESLDIDISVKETK